jgi:hypothetical protein
MAECSVARQTSAYARAIPHKESAELCDSERVLHIQCFGFRRLSFSEVLILKYTFEDPISNLERRA